MSVRDSHIIVMKSLRASWTYLCYHHFVPFLTGWLPTLLHPLHPSNPPSSCQAVKWWRYVGARACIFPLLAATVYNHNRGIVEPSGRACQSTDRGGDYTA